MNEYTVYYPTSLMMDDREYSTISFRIISLAPVPVEEYHNGDKWPLWMVKYESTFLSGVGLYLDPASYIITPDGDRYEYRDFPRLAAKIANDELERILGVL